jgi:hypothetical protein
MSSKAVAEKQGSSALEILLHPVVILNMSDHYTRAKVAPPVTSWNIHKLYTADFLSTVQPESCVQFTKVRSHRRIPTPESLVSFWVFNPVEDSKSSIPLRSCSPSYVPNFPPRNLKNCPNSPLYLFNFIS